MFSRRDFAKIAVAGVPLSMALAKIDSTIDGVRLGVQSYSFRDRPLDRAIQAMVEDGLGDCELYSPHVEPRVARDALRQWRLTVPLDNFKAIRKKFDDAGVGLYAFNLSIVDDFTEEEIDRGFQMAKALGVNVITSSSTLTAAKRIVPFADQHRMTVAFHGHTDTRDPNQFAKPESFAAALAMSKRFMVNLDIGHFTAANYDPVEFIRANHDRIVLLHLKDKKKNQGPNVPWGEGDTPIKPVLLLLKEKKYPIRAFIEYEYKGKGDAVVEVKKCFEYCKDALA
jgi:sugar phosphate isomerase/epimerase